MPVQYFWGIIRQKRWETIMLAIICLRRTARYFSPLNVEMYLKKSSLISYTPKGLARAAQAVVKIAAVEGLEGHANSIRVRLESQGTGVEDNGQNRQD